MTRNNIVKCSKNFQQYGGSVTLIYIPNENNFKKLWHLQTALKKNAYQ